VGRIYDLTLPLGGKTLLFPGDPPPRIYRVSTIEGGAALTTSAFETTCHVGTHVDAPAHYLSEARWLSDYAAEDFCGPAVVIDLSADRHVTPGAIEAARIPPGRHVLLRTRNSGRLHDAHYDYDHAAIEPDAAGLLLVREPLSIGFDYYSVDEAASEDLDVHRLFAAAGLLVYLCLDLSAAPAGAYRFFGLPLRLTEVEGAPVRAVLSD
jgi:arylformamidase